MTDHEHQSLVSTDWLAAHLDDPNLVVLDGSFKLPGATPTAAEDYAQRHIRGARFFDVDVVADVASGLPHMLPAPEAFAESVGAMGIGNDTLVAVYDSHGLMSAARVWWTFHIFGHDQVVILNGGLKKWLAEGRPVTDEVPRPTPAVFNARFRPELVRSKADLLANLHTRSEQVIDARSAGRFNGTEKEARPGLRSGHIPGSLNLPFNHLTTETGALKPAAEIKALFTEAGLDLGRPVVASCGSGVTACALAFGLHLIGMAGVAVYDGAWAEWGRPGETPVELQ